MASIGHSLQSIRKAFEIPTMRSETTYSVGTDVDEKSELGFLKVLPCHAHYFHGCAVPNPTGCSANQLIMPLWEEGWVANGNLHRHDVALAD
jgi:hypothetical protein